MFVPKFQKYNTRNILKNTYLRGYASKAELKMMYYDKNTVLNCQRTIVRELSLKKHHRTTINNFPVVPLI